MNSVKNAIVTMTMLAVGYGAYVVLSNPVPEDLAELSEDSEWQSPEVTTPGSDASTSLATATQSPVDPTAASAASPTDLPPLESIEPPSDLSTPWPPTATTTDAEPLPAGPTSATSTLATNSTAASGSENPAGAPGTAPSASGDPSTNFYVSQSGTQPPPTDASAGTATPPATGGADAATRASTSDSGDAGNPEFEAAWQTVQADLSSGQLGAALGTLSTWYSDRSLSTEQRERLLPLLDQVAGTVIYSRDSYLEPGHVVQQGETLQSLAQQYQVPVEFLARINGIEPPHEPYPGETIKVVQGPFRAEVNRGQRQITLFLGRHYAGRFRARIGPELPPDANAYEVASIEPGIEYFDTRSGQRIAHDDPQNPYGSVWISLRGNQITTAHRVGIHVDNGDPQRGCIGVSQTDASDLAAILGPGSAIEVAP